MKRNLEKIYEYIHRKFILVENNLHNNYLRGRKVKAWNEVGMYIEELQGEIEEMKSEIKKENSVHLEDELGDILWDYLNIVYLLENQDYIYAENVIQRCEKKYEERINGIEKGVAWNDIKKLQKQKLKEEHDKKYNS